jgi:hypothetical protein
VRILGNEYRKNKERKLGLPIEDSHQELEGGMNFFPMRWWCGFLGVVKG